MGVGTSSKERIANMALLRVGADSISTFDDDNKSANAIKACYDEILNEVLTAHPWSFAQKRADLTLEEGTPEFTDDGVDKIYTRPDDLLKITYANVQGAIIKLESEGILSDVADLEILYTALEEDTTKYFAQFIAALVERLAAQIAYRITASSTVASALQESYLEDKLPAAVAADSQQNTPPSVIQNQWEIARLSSGGGIAGRSGWETFYPVRY